MNKQDVGVSITVVGLAVTLIMIMGFSDCHNTLTDAIFSFALATTAFGSGISIGSSK